MSVPMMSMPVLIVGSDLRHYVRQEMLMSDIEFGLMLVAALDAIHASERDGHEWSSRVLHDDSTLCLDNHGGDWILVCNKPKAQKLCLPDGMVAASEAPKAKKQRLQNEMVAVSEKSEASVKTVEKGSAMTKTLVVSAFFKRALISHQDFCFMLGDAIDAISSGEHRALAWKSHPCNDGDVFSLDKMGDKWLLELGPEGKGNQIKGCAGKSNTSGNSWDAQAGNWQRWNQGDAKGGEAHGKGTGKL